MNIEVGKYYRMRCGGAVKIVAKIDGYFTEYEMCGARYEDDGTLYHATTDIFDLIAEITEAEYNRIVSGEPDGNTEQLQAEIEALKNKLADAYGKLEDMQERNVELLKYNTTLKVKLNEYEGPDVWKRINQRTDRDQRRFELVKEAMAGICSNSNFTKLEFKEVARGSVGIADAVIESLEGTK